MKSQSQYHTYEDTWRIERPAPTALVSPVRILWQARCKATREEEHAVSRLMLGPLMSKYQDILLAIIAVPILPFASYRL